MLSVRGLENKWDLPHSYGSVYGIEEAHALLEVLNDKYALYERRIIQFEKKFSELVGGKYGVATNSWGGAAHLVAILMDLKEGDEVIIPALSMSATANFFVREGAKIVFADINPHTFNIDVNDLESKITEKTKVIVIVHMCGQPCEMDSILSIVKEHNLYLVQDAAHAPGALYKNKGLASFGDFTIYSFHQAKNMNTLGEGGMVVVNDQSQERALKSIRGHGGGQYIGVSNRMMEFQAAVGLIQLERLKEHNDTRRRLSYYANLLLSDVEGIGLPYEIPEIYHVYHLYNLRIDEKRLGIGRKEFINQLWKQRKIMTISYYPTVNCIEAYLNLGHGKGECPIAEETTEYNVVLPMSPRYRESDIDEMVDGIKHVLNSIQNGVVQ